MDSQPVPNPDDDCRICTMKKTNRSTSITEVVKYLKGDHINEKQCSIF
ncbi:MAG TPA: hypothetical protein VK119_00040 [Bacillota bacterium]|nr:hypothetical protein [Bacillota bacterium]